jgi:hypothetical protein
MRYRIFIALCVIMLGSAWAQEAGAVDAAPDGSQSAYDIFGLSPADDPAEEPDTATLVQSAVDEPVDEEPAADAEAADSRAEEALAEEAPAEEAPTEEAPAEEAPILDNEPEAVDEAGGDEAVLRDEIMRLLAERDALYDEINQIKEENFTLAKAAQEADGYKARNVELEAQVALLEEALAVKEAELAAAEARIAEISAQLEEEGARLADAEARLAASGGDQAAIDTLLAEKNAAIAERDAMLGAVGTELSGKDAVIEAKDAEIRIKDEKIASKDAELATAGTELSIRAAIIEAKDADIRVRDGQIVAKDVELLDINKRLAAAESDLAVSKKALADAQAALAKTGSVPAAPAASTPVTSAAPAASTPPAVTASPAAAGVGKGDSASASLAAAVADAERRVAAITAERDAAVAVRDAAVASREAAETLVRAAEASRAEAEAALVSALASGTVVRGTGTTTVPAPAAPAKGSAAAPASTGGYLSGWSLDTSKFHKNLRTGFDGSLARMGSWKITGQTAAQTDASQYFSRLEMPLAQGKAATLYRFKARSTGKGWIGLGLHIFVEDNKKKRGYGEGKSLLVWFTRDKSTRGDDATYLQLFRSDTDVVMERMFDAELQDGLAAWRLVEIVYDPVADYIAVSVDGVLRAVYKTFFGRDAGATVSLRTLGGGGAFLDFSAWTE